MSKVNHGYTPRAMFFSDDLKRIEGLKQTSFSQLYHLMQLYDSDDFNISAELPFARDPQLKTLVSQVQNNDKQALQVLDDTLQELGLMFYTIDDPTEYFVVKGIDAWWWDKKQKHWTRKPPSIPALRTERMTLADLVAAIDSFVAFRFY